MSGHLKWLRIAGWGCLVLGLLIFSGVTAMAVVPGDLDTDFGSNGWVTTAIGSDNDYGLSTAIQADGKVVVAGFSNNGADYDFAVVRYNADGSLDTGFGTGGQVTTAIGAGHDYGYAVAIQADGKIVVAGASTNGADFDVAVVRYNTDGSLDTGFGTGGKLTTAIGAGQDHGYAVAIQADGKIVVAGYANTGGALFDFAAVRYNTDGSLDAGFGTGGKVTTVIGASYSAGQSVAIQTDGKIVVAGYVHTGGYDDIAVVRYNADGSLDAAFGTGGQVTTAIGTLSEDGYSVAIQDDGKIVVAGVTQITVSDYDFALVRYNADGSLDTGFGTGGKVTTSFSTGKDYGYSVAIQADGKMVVAGYAYNGADFDIAVARYNADGSLDTGFGTGGQVTTAIGPGQDNGRSEAIRADGNKVVVAGYAHNGTDYDIAVLRYYLTDVVDSTGAASSLSANGVGGGGCFLNALTDQ